MGFHFSLGGYLKGRLGLEYVGTAYLAKQLASLDLKLPSVIWCN